MPELTLKDYLDAVQVQNACNLSGVLYSFARVMDRLCNDVPDTSKRNKHPLVILYLDKLNSLSGADSLNTVMKAYDAVYDTIRDMGGEIPQ